MRQQGEHTRKRQLREALLSHVANHLLEHGWGQVGLEEHGHDIVAHSAAHPGRRLIVEIKSAPDARVASLRAGLAEALLSARLGILGQADSPWALALVGAPRLTDSLLARLRMAADTMTRGLALRSDERVAWGFVDETGRIEVHGLDGHPAIGLSAEHAPQSRSSAPVPEPFGDIGQWLLKVLLAPRIEADYLRAPRRNWRTASELAREARASMASARRVVRYLREHAHVRFESKGLQVVRTAELLRTWRGRLGPPAAELRARFALPTRDAEAALARGLVRLRGERTATFEHGEPSSSRGGLIARQPRACLAMSSACRQMGLSVVRGGPSAIVMDDVGEDGLRLLGLTIAAPTEPVEVIVRVPTSPESVFRAAVMADGVECTDVLQCWLDLASHGFGAREEEQAESLESGPLRKLLAEDE